MITYEILSKESLVRMLNHAFGPSIGVLGNAEFSSVANFLTYDILYAPLSIIMREIKRAITMGLIQMDEITRVLSFTEAGLKFMEENSITDGVNPKLYKAIELDAKGVGSLSRTLRMEIDKEGLFWWPPEWPGRSTKITFVKADSETPARREPDKKQVPPTTGDEIKVTKKPPRPVRL
jgi:hypothetical protein